MAEGLRPGRRPAPAQALPRRPPRPLPPVRPSRHGSYPWTYHLGEEGHRLLQHAGDIPDRQRYKHDVIDYSRVLHDIQLNAWVLAYRRALGDALLGWDGETTIDPPPGCAGSTSDFDDDWSPEGLHHDRPRRSAPTPSLEIAGDTRPEQPADLRRVRPHPAPRQELRQVPPLRRLPHLVVAPHPARRPRRPAVRAVRLPRRRAARPLPRRRRPRSSPATAGTPTCRPSGTSTSAASASSSRRRSTRTHERSKLDACRCSHAGTPHGGREPGGF